MAYDFLVIGATGIQGRISTRDLLQSGYSVLMTGRQKWLIDRLLRRYKKTGFVELDLRDKKNIVKIIKESGSKIVLNCADGNFNLDVLKACLQAGANYLDLGSDDWMTVEQFKLDKALRKKNLIGITGCGSTPGIVSVMAGYASGELDSISRIDAGFAWDSNMKTFVVPYSIPTIVDEFVKKAPMVKDGRKKMAEPLSITLNHSLPRLGRLMSRNILHQEVYTFNNSFKNKKVKDITYYCAFPEHSFNTIMTMINLGLCRNNPTTVDGKKIENMDFLVEVLKKLNVPKGYKEREDLWVNMYGKKNGKEKKIDMVCTAGTIKGWEDATCNVDTGMPISIMAQMIKRGDIKARGSFAPELIVSSGIFFEELAKRKMYVYENGKKIN